MQRTDLAALSRAELEALTWRLHGLARELANRLGEDSKTSSRPPSSDDPYKRGETERPASAEPDGGTKIPSTKPGKPGEPGKRKAARRAGKQPGTKGFWRSQPIVTSMEAPHAPTVCAACGASLGPDLE